jgi:excisionase family DNA binding protein
MNANFTRQSSGRLTVAEIAKRLRIGPLAVYAMLESGALPGLRIGRRWLVTRSAYEEWERTCGSKKPAAAAMVSPPASRFLT